MKAKIIRGVITTVVIAAILGAGAYSLNTQYHFIPASPKAPASATESGVPVQTETIIQTEPATAGVAATDPVTTVPSPSEGETSSSENHSDEASGKQAPSETVTIEGLSYRVDWLEVPDEVPDQVKTESLKTIAREEYFIGNRMAPGYTYVLLDLTIQNVGDATISGRTLNSCCISTINGDGSFNARMEMCYYEGGKPSSRTSYHFSLKAHETQTFRVGFILIDELFQAGQTCLLVNPYGIYVNLLTADDLRTIPLDIY